jgi:hypothetical protein
VIEAVDETAIDGVAWEHLRKPDEAYELVERLVPETAFKADMFSRQERPRWDCWGDRSVSSGEILAASRPSGRGTVSVPVGLAPPKVRSISGPPFARQGVRLRARSRSDDSELRRDRDA